MSDEDQPTTTPREPTDGTSAPQMPDPSVDLLDTELTCPECDYNLTGAPGDRCPWCGWRIDVDELVASVAARRSQLRWGVAATALCVGVGSFVVLGAQLVHGHGLSWRDGLAVMAVLVAAVGHLSLAGMVVRSRRHWPMRVDESATVLRFAGWLSIVSGVVAATSLLSAAPTPRIVRGVAVNGVLEFAMTGFFYALPGTMLLVLRLVSFRHAGEKFLSRFAGLRSRESVAGIGAPFFIEIEGRYTSDQLSQTWTEDVRPTAPNIEEMIARTWEAETNLAVQSGRNLYNGRLARLVGAEASATGLSLRLGDTCYRDFLGTNLFNAAKVARINPAFLADAVGTSSIVLTSDGFLALGRRSDRVAFHAGFLHTFGGMLEAADRRADGYDIFGGVKREVMEELGVGESEIGSVVLTGLARDVAIRQPEMLFDLGLTLTRAELSARFHPGLSDGEHTAIEFLSDDPEAVVRFLVRTSRIAPVAQAGVLLHGKHHWGADWYEQSCYLLYGGVPSAPAGS
jgi:8-oxo-dGTP pyrophosphatase MutT (NUDIX family)